MAFLYDAGALGLDDRSIDYVNDTLKVLVVNSNYTPDSSHATVSAVVAGGSEAIQYGTRLTLTTKTITQNTATSPNQNEYKANTSFVYNNVPAGANTRALVFYKEVTNDADSIPLVYLNNTPVDFPTNGGDVTFNQPANGWFKKELVGTT